MIFPQEVPTPIPLFAPSAAPAAAGAPAAATIAATPLPLTVDAAASAATTGATVAPTTDLASILALVVYLAFFGWIGYRRGATRETITFVVSLGMFFLLQRFSDRFVSIADKFGKGVAFATGQEIPAVSPLGAWAEANQTTFLISIWLMVVLFTYFMTQHFVRKSKSNGWAVLAGWGNALVFATVFAPLLTGLIFPGAAPPDDVNHLLILSFLGNIWNEFLRLFGEFWALIGPLDTQVVFLGLVVLVLLAAFTLRTSAKAKK